MSNKRNLLWIVALTGILLLIPLVAVYASVYNGTVAFTCTNANASGSGSHVLDRDNTGLGQERLRVDITDGAGTLIFTLTYQNSLGTYSGGIGSFIYTTAPQFNPLTFKLTSLAGNGLPEQVDYVQQGTCAGLPTFSDACRTPLPSGSVVGEAPLGAQVYWRPGELSPGVVLNPGTYWVVGVDASGDYSQIWLACETDLLWVRSDALQPSFQAPQNGQPLPTRVVR